MTGIQATATRDSERLAWIPAAAALLGTGWGSNQFTPMLLVYRHALGLSTGTLEAMFGLYALGLIPGLLVAGPLSDARGRRAVVVPAAALSFVATLALVVAGHHVVLLFLGRLLAGVSNGAVFGAGTAWLRELSLDTGSGHASARRTAIAMTAGFAVGPLVAGLLAQWAAQPRIIPYVPHLVFMALVLVMLRDVPETVRASERPAVRLSAPGARSPRFRRVVAPMAPWTFAAPAIAFALLPSVVGAERATDGVALTAMITALCALSGVLIQPLGRRLDARGNGNLAATVGLSVLVAGMALAAITAEVDQTWLLVPSAIVFGSTYGLCLVAGLVEVQRIANDRALASLTAVFYALTYLGFAAPYGLAVGAHFAAYSVLLGIGAILALATAVSVTRASRRTLAPRI